MDEQTLEQQITLLAGQINAATYRFLKLVAEFDQQRGWSCNGTVRSCAHWLNWRCGIAMGAAREKVRVARCLDELPLINTAFETGEISYSKVRAMTRVATNDNESYLLMIAQHGTASHMEQLVRKYHRVEERQSRTANHAQDARQVLYHYGDDGMLHLHAKLPAEVGALVVKALNAVLRQELADKREKALVEDGGFIVEHDDEESVPAETFPQKRADAIGQMAEHYIASWDNGDGIQSLRGHEKCQVMLHVSTNTPDSHVDEQWVSPDTARHLACDASLVKVTEGSDGEVLNIGRRSRTVPPAIKRALEIRDSSCRFPGCCESRYTEAHHVKHWADGGETSLNNLVTLCTFHHRQLHAGCFKIVAIESPNRPTQFDFQSADGGSIERGCSFRRTAPTGNDPSIGIAQQLQELASQLPDIDCYTARTKWRGEVMDYQMGVQGLLQRKERSRGNVQSCTT
jgi:hypothetical protein